ncbi:HlyD family secretion protein [Variovorax sp. ZT4R33]|uniref:HlyD family secretion protein n=1 Tax=Variovorax sp. ZT4R33 TaxID=3443743 RepID=UPI003F47A578
MSLDQVQTSKGHQDGAFFRPEVFTARKDAWLGDVALTRSFSFVMLATGFLLASAALIAFAVWGEYTKKIRASGYVVPDLGVVKIGPSQPGVVARMLVVEGQHVVAGDTLAILNSERATAGGDASAEVQKQIRLRHAALRQEQSKVNELFDGQLKALAVRIANLRVELSQIDAAFRLQEERIRLTDQILGNQRKLHAERFISDMALQQKEQERMSDLSALETIKRSRMTLLRELASSEADKEALPARHANELSAIERNLAALEQDRIENEARRELLLKAPQPGVVTAIITDVGRPAVPGQTLLSLIPAGAQLQADVYLPSRAAGFVRVGSQALLQFQAFPYQKFGSQRAEVVRLSRVALGAAELPYPAPAGAAPGELFYVASLALSKTTVLAYGKEEPLQAGMGFDASLLLETRSLLEWVFEPLYSVSGKWAH